MKLGFTPQEERFRAEAAAWLEGQLSGPFRDMRGLTSQGGHPQRRRDWERALGEARWSCIGWPAAYGGRDASLAEQVIFAEECARAGAPGRLGYMGVELAGPTILAFGTDAQKRRFLPPIARGEELWCQGYSEPNAGSDLAGVRTRAALEEGPGGGQWVVNGQKTWTSFAQYADWSFVLCRTEEGSRGHRGLSYLLIPMHQPGVTVRPIRQMTGGADFNDTFFVDARTDADNVVGAAGDGWRVAMATLSFERGVSTLAQQMSFANELRAIVSAAEANGLIHDPQIRQRFAHAYIGLRLMRYSALRMLASAEAGKLSNEAYTYKIFWATWRKKLGVLALDVLGPRGEIAAGASYEWELLPRLFLGSRADTIYGGTSQIQRNIIAERALGLPRESRSA
ncbi:MAG TPA: acyl-CoA dehydrogenase family protein [Steroidobacteraceae bacterium]|jgi:alkylation response protein AidB-like acyl-CoA dehydrogenase|nr:acyl-CoA dehydrogenase family protein [Steroidobacteraceae bacterium]